MHHFDIVYDEFGTLLFLVAFSCIFRKSMYFEEKIEASLTPALAPGASIGKNMVGSFQLSDSQ